jgi:hypothetical protein
LPADIVNSLITCQYLITGGNLKIAAFNLQDGGKRLVIFE